MKKEKGKVNQRIENPKRLSILVSWLYVCPKAYDL